MFRHFLRTAYLTWYATRAWLSLQLFVTTTIIGMGLSISVYRCMSLHLLPGDITFFSTYNYLIPLHQTRKYPFLPVTPRLSPKPKEQNRKSKISITEMKGGRYNLVGILEYLLRPASRRRSSNRHI